MHKRLTYFQAISLILICILFLAYFSFPTLIELFQKKIDLSIELPEDTVPFLIVEKIDKNSMLSTVYLGFWDIENGIIYRDDVQSVCEINGDIGQIFWTGNKQIVLTPYNERGVLEISTKDPSFQILVKPIENSVNTLIKPSFDAKKMYQLSIDPNKGNLTFIIHSKGKSLKIEESSIPMYPDCKLVKPIYLIPENFEPVILCLFQSKKNPEKGLGIMEGTLRDNVFSWQLLQGLNESLTFANLHDITFYNSHAIMSYEKELNVEQIINEKETRPLSSINNYLALFHNYLFKASEKNKFFDLMDIKLIKKGINFPRLNTFRDLLLVNWEPSFTSSKKFFIKHVIAQNNIRTLGRIEVLGSKFRIYRDTLLLREIEGDNRYLDSQWVFPNE